MAGDRWQIVDFLLHVASGEKGLFGTVEHCQNLIVAGLGQSAAMRHSSALDTVEATFNRASGFAGAKFFLQRSAGGCIGNEHAG